MKSGTVADRVGVSVQTIRFYERRRLGGKETVLTNLRRRVREMEHSTTVMHLR